MGADRAEINDSAGTARVFPDDESLKALAFSTLFCSFPILLWNAV
jgi:hypothetical protein